ncbi:hypothetical protein 8014-B2_0084 [Lactobacillus phage ATCC 8014-B2]|uniref:Uncharacterized protein n=1 Tax=Lactobacillus phage ATCC 8014-B2 TaxID=1225795 RepID=K4HZU1_9CAUD|nr:hypothetical protein HOQ89_gp062 [Lactobacillus phage ATCC 8014-B2]AFU63151.1 hypothetical protein 8014-B2_0084 [Lactobacillus phage ATCC 8014-B2]
MKTFVSAITFLLVALFMIIFYGLVASVLGVLWGFNVTALLAVKCGITAYILSIVLPMIMVPASSQE